jgi:hypothetical protein
LFDEFFGSGRDGVQRAFSSYIDMGLFLPNVEFNMCIGFWGAYFAPNIKAPPFLKDGAPIT